MRILRSSLLHTIAFGIKTIYQIEQVLPSVIFVRVVRVGGGGESFSCGGGGGGGGCFVIGGGGGGGALAGTFGTLFIGGWEEGTIIAFVVRVEGLIFVDGFG